MLLSTLELKDWKKVAPYVDTVCLPIYSISNANKQLNLQSAQAIEQIATLLEKKISGRLLLLPAICYAEGEPSIFQQYLIHLMREFLRIGFHYVVTISDHPIPTMDPKEIEQIHCCMDLDRFTEEEIVRFAERCFQQTLDLWVKNI